MNNREQLKKVMLEKKVWAVIGASPNVDKFGYKVWRKLQEHGYEAYPVNPRYEEIEGEKCYKSLKDIPNKPEVIDFVIPPSAIFEWLSEAKEVGIDYLWCQPGAANQEVVLKAEELGFNIAYNVCVLAELGE